MFSCDWKELPAGISREERSEALFFLAVSMRKVKEGDEGFSPVLAVR